MSLKHHNAKLNGTAPAMTPAQLAHELNNLLDGSLRSVGMVIRQLTQLGADPDTTDQLAQRLRTADQSMHHMADVIERFANPPPPGNFPHGPGHLPTHSENEIQTGDTSVAATFRGRGTLLDALTHAVSVYGPTIQEHNIELVTRFDPAATRLPAGPLYTVLANALNNALQAIERSDTQAGHRITLQVLAVGNQIDLEICDTGPGLDPRLFDRRGAFRFGVTTRPDGHGIGLGVCRQIAHDLGGHLVLTNYPHPQRGTRFTLNFPRAAMEQHHESQRLAG